MRSSSSVNQKPRVLETHDAWEKGKTHTSAQQSTHKENEARCRRKGKRKRVRGRKRLNDEGREEATKERAEQDTGVEEFVK